MNRAVEKIEGWYINPSDGDIEYVMESIGYWLYINDRSSAYGTTMAVNTLELQDPFSFPEEIFLKDYFVYWKFPTEDELILWNIEWPFPYINQEVLDRYNLLHDNTPNA